jgi:hypothetical protein
VSGRKGLRLAVLAAAVLAVAACTGTASSAPASASNPSAAAPSASLVVPESPVEGLITAIDGDGLTSVNSITVQTPEGETHVFRVGTLEVPVPPAHLNEHMAGALPVAVHFREEGGELVAYRIDDA